MGILTWLIEALVVAGGLILWHFAKKENSMALKGAAVILVVAGLGAFGASTVRFVRYCNLDSKGAKMGSHWRSNDPYHHRGMFHLRGMGMESSGPMGHPGVEVMDEAVQKCSESAPKEGDFSTTSKHFEKCLKANLKGLRPPAGDDGSQ
ncbi:MAG: hypothetical protein KDD43_02105 [Bdellovibrionales bacterium]|nr:hypothetical protein [Bdellovibrionales bacterium]